MGRIAAIDEQLLLTAEDAGRFAALELLAGAGSLPPAGDVPSFTIVRALSSLVPHVLSLPSLAVDPTAVLHVAQEIDWLAPVPAGAPLGTVLEVERVADIGFRRGVVVRVEVRDGERLVAVLRSTLTVGHDVTGVRVTDVLSPQPARTDQIAETALTLPLDLSARYAEASGDDNPVHLDPAVAAAAGHPAPIAHGMGVLLLVAAQGRQLAGAGPKLTGVASRFTSPAFPGEEVQVTWFATAEPGVVAFDARASGRVVLRHGLVRTEPAAA